MFAHLDDPVPPLAADQLGEVRRRFARRHRRRWLARGSVSIALVGAVVLGFALFQGSTSTQVQVVSSPATSARRVAVSGVSFLLPAGWHAAAVPVDPSSMGYTVLVASSQALHDRCQPLTVFSRGKRPVVEPCHFRVPTASAGAVSVSWSLLGLAKLGGLKFDHVIGGRNVAINIGPASDCAGNHEADRSVLAEYLLGGGRALTAAACLPPTHIAAETRAVRSIFYSSIVRPAQL